MTEVLPPTLDAIRRALAANGDHVRRTPVTSLPMSELDPAWRRPTEAVFKLELFQRTGTFKARSALSVMRSLTPEQGGRGVTAVSAGNHAVAVAYAARALGMSAKVVMLRTANPLRVDLTRAMGAQVEFAENGGAAFERVREIQATEGRYFVHPFEGPDVVTGTGTVGLEWHEQTGPMDAVVVAVGGGGLIAGVASAIKQLAPQTAVYGVEPEGADAMARSFETGAPVTLPTVATIADSLAPPMTTPYTFAVCRRHVERIVRVTDADLRAAMRISFRGLKLAVEPAGAAALAGVLGPLRATLEERRRIGILVCGANIDPASYSRMLATG